MRLIGTCSMLLGLLGAACVPGNSPVRITEAWPTDTTCKFNDMVGITRGTLDASGAGTYLLGLDIDSDLEPMSTLDPMGNEISGKGLNNFVTEFLAVTYTAKDAMTGAAVGGAFAPEQIPINDTVPPASTKNKLITEIIGPKAADKLRTVVTDPMQSVILTVTMALKGHIESGGQLQSNNFAFPIIVTTTGQNCTNGWAATGPCGTGGGQDGTVVTCL